MSLKIVPVGERVLIKPLETETKTKGGIYIPETAKEERKEGIIIELGTKVDNSLGLKKNQKIIYTGYSNDELKIENEKYIMVEYKNIIAIVEDK
jgi:chaperonin GroES